ncbi:luciferin 4-monooxygenase-like [Chironomus tepperi]|uniref:luciferin 4-monooxygenase-like n=1 Tax=Chironomus tepperi TaxID=113505 RepID=UPI00391FC6E7
MSKPSFDPVNKIWHGPKIPPIYNPNQNLGQLILRILQQNQDSVIQISADTGATVTCQQMHDQSIRIAKHLTICGKKEGDLIGFVTGNSENLAPIVFACFALGLPVNPLSPIMNEKDIVQMFTMTKPKMIFCDADNVKVVQNAVDEMKSEAKVLTVMDKVDGHECATEILKEMEGESVYDFEFPSIDPNSTAVVLCSSGSTGFPKGICKSHKQLITNFQQLWPSTHKGIPIHFQYSPIFWLTGLYALIATIFYRSIRICSAKSLSPQQLVDTINKYKVTLLLVPPFVLVSLLQLENIKPLETVQTVLVGGSVVSEQLCVKFRPYLPNGYILVGYGCTEQDFLAVNYAKVSGCCGQAFINTELKIIDESGTTLGPNSSGEILAKRLVKFSGYIDDPEKTAEAFDDEWFKTGDIGYFDNNGNLFILDRKKEMLKYNGYQVTPSEIEEIINNIKGVLSSCVVGVPKPNTGNDILHAFVIFDDSCDITADYVLNYVNSKVIDVKRIRGGVHVVGSFPLGATGKVDRKKVREIAEANFLCLNIAENRQF